MCMVMCLGVQISIQKVKTTVNVEADLLDRLHKALIKYYGKIKGAQERVIEDSVKLWLGMFTSLRVYAGKVMDGKGRQRPVVVTGRELPALFSGEDFISCTVNVVDGKVVDEDVKAVLEVLGFPDAVWARRGDTFQKVEGESVEKLFEEGFEDIVFLWGLSGRAEMPFTKAKQALYVSHNSLDFSR